MFSQKTFYDRLMELKDSLGISQNEFARNIGVNAQNLSSYSPDNPKPSMPKANFIFMLMKAYPEANIKYILGLENDKSKVSKTSYKVASDKHNDLMNQFEEEDEEYLSPQDEISDLKEEVEKLRFVVEQQQNEIEGQKIEITSYIRALRAVGEGLGKNSKQTEKVLK